MTAHQITIVLFDLATVIGTLWFARKFKRSMIGWSMLNCAMPGFALLWLLTVGPRVKS
jgi:hypothetical protein